MYLNCHDIYLTLLFLSLDMVIFPKITGQIGFRKTVLLSLFTFLFCLLGWESWWSLGIIRGSTDYYLRYSRMYPSKTPTSPDFVHAVVQAFGDIVIISYIFQYGFKIYPRAKYKLNLDFIYFISLIGVSQNIIATAFSVFSPFNPNTDVLSWSPIAGNVTCDNHRIVCFNNQRMWLITPVVNYLFLLLLNIKF